MSSSSPTVSRFTSLDDRPQDQPIRERGGRSLTRTVNVDHQADSWKNVAAGSVVPLGIAGAAAFATYVTTHERVAITAWIAVAVVGSASVIAAASSSLHRTVELDRSKGGKSTTLPGRARDTGDWGTSDDVSDSFESPQHQ